MTVWQKIILVIALAVGVLCAFAAKRCGAEEIQPTQEPFWQRIIPDFVKDKVQIGQQISEQVKRDRAFVERCKAVNPALANDPKVLAFLKIMEQEKTKDIYKQLTGSDEVPPVLLEPDRYQKSPAPVRTWLNDRPVRSFLRDLTRPANAP